jgi:iron(III) transport system substrate-binding protein
VVRHRRLLAVLLAAALAGCGRAPAATVVVYTSEDQVFSEPILKDFERSSGIAVHAVYDTEETKSTGVALRIVAERDHPQADVFWANEPLRAVMLKREDLLQPYESPGRRDIPARYRDPDGYWTGFAARARVILYNTRQVKPDEVPSSVGDLIDPRWKSRAGLANPLFGTTTTQIAALFTLWGDHAAIPFLLAVKRNDVKLVTSNGEARDLVAAGDLAWAFCDTDDANVALEQKKPVAVVYPDQDNLGHARDAECGGAGQERTASGDCSEAHRLSALARRRGAPGRESRRPDTAPSGRLGTTHREAGLGDQGHGRQVRRSWPDDRPNPAAPEGVGRSS